MGEGCVAVEPMGADRAPQDSQTIPSSAPHRISNVLEVTDVIFQGNIS